MNVKTVYSLIHALLTDEPRQASNETERSSIVQFSCRCTCTQSYMDMNGWPFTIDTVTQLHVHTCMELRF